MTTNNWWAKKLSTATPVSTTPPVSPPSGNVYRPPAPPSNPQVSYDQQQDQLVTRQPQSAIGAEFCPGCRSGNYMAPMGTQRKRCYDCGYPLVQSGTGASGTGSSSSGPARPARQVGQDGGFNPQTIVGRLE